MALGVRCFRYSLGPIFTRDFEGEGNVFWQVHSVILDRLGLFGRHLSNAAVLLVFKRFFLENISLRPEFRSDSSFPLTGFQATCGLLRAPWPAFYLRGVELYESFLCPFPQKNLHKNQKKSD